MRKSCTEHKFTQGFHCTKTHDDGAGAAAS